jgi:hypothetical protein
LAIAWSIAGSARADDGLQQAGSVAAPNPQKSQAAPKDWRDLSTAACGMACRYHRANDNYTLQALYLITKIEKIGRAVQTDEPAARTALGAFCRSSSEPVQACFDRYKAFQRVALLQIREGMGRNQETIARLTSGRKSDGSVEGDAITFASGKDEANGYVPEVPSLTELENAYLQGNLKPRGGRYSANDIRKWSQELVGYGKTARYMEFQKEAVAGNPHASDKSEYKLHMMKRSGNDEAVTDATVEKEAKKSDAEIAGYSKGNIDTSSVTALTPAQLKDKDAISFQSLVEARTILNSKIEGDLPGSRSPASVKKTDGKTEPGKTDAKDPKAPGDSKDILINSANRTPSGKKTYGPDDKVQPPAQSNGSRYIRYDMKDFFNQIESSTK